MRKHGIVVWWSEGTEGTITNTWGRLRDNLALEHPDLDLDGLEDALDTAGIYRDADHVVMVVDGHALRRLEEGK